MSTKKRSKINHMLATVPHGVVLLSSWLKTQGYSLSLLKRYKTSGWIQSIGTGAMIRVGDEVDHYGAIYSLQKQADLKVHIGGRTALSLLGKAHYLELNPKKAVLFGTRHQKLPSWFMDHDWNTELEYHCSTLLPSELGLMDIQIKEFKIKVSSEIRAMLECLHLAPRYQELSECYELMESMNHLRPTVVQELLQQCSSIKTKRLFLCLAQRVGHEWFHHLNMPQIDIGKGKRSIIKHGLLDSTYQITIPHSWEKHDKRSLSQTG